jgi:hypothetical protein
LALTATEGLKTTQLAALNAFLNSNHAETVYTTTRRATVAAYARPYAVFANLQSTDQAMSKPISVSSLSSMLMILQCPELGPRQLKQQSKSL